MGEPADANPCGVHGEGIIMKNGDPGHFEEGRRYLEQKGHHGGESEVDWVSH